MKLKTLIINKKYKIISVLYLISTYATITGFKDIGEGAVRVFAHL